MLLNEIKLRCSCFFTFFALQLEAQNSELSKLWQEKQIIRNAFLLNGKRAKLEIRPDISAK